jgi:hypothetical protein
VQKTLRSLLKQMGVGKKHEHDALLVLTNEITGEQRRIWGRNIVTTAGNVWYAQKSCGQAPTNDFDTLYLATANDEAGGNPTVTSTYSNFTVVAGSSKHVTATYPMSPDTDADNTGDGTTVVSWAFAYLVADGPFAAITHSFIAKTGAGAGDPILNGYKWGAAWAKDAATSCKVFANHTMLGS